MSFFFDERKFLHDDFLKDIRGDKAFNKPAPAA